MPLTAEQRQRLADAPAETRYRFMARKFARQYGVDPDLYEAQITQESQWDPLADSGKARGLAQFTPDTGASYGLVAPEDFTNPAKSLHAGAKHMGDLLAKYKDPSKALQAYHDGEPNFEAGIIGPEGAEYVPSIMAHLDTLRASRAGRAPGAPQPVAPVRPPAPAAQPAGPASVAAAATLPTPPPPAGVLAQIGSGALESAASAFDIPGAVSAYVGDKARSAVGLGPSVPIAPTASELVAPVLSGAPQGVAERYARAGGQGIPFGPLGVVGGLTGEAGGDVTEAAFGTRLPGEIVGGVLGPGAVAGRQLVKNVSRVKAAAKLEEAVAKDVVESAKSEAQAVVSAAKSQATDARTTADAMAADYVAQAEAQGAARVAQVEQQAQQMAAQAGGREAQAAQAVDNFLIDAPPTARAEMLESALNRSREAFRDVRSPAYDTFLAAHGNRPVSIETLAVDGKAMLADQLRRGIPRDLAQQRADDIVELAGKSPTMRFDDAKALRTYLGKMGGRAEGAAESHFGRLYGQLDDAMRAALPDGDVLKEWDRINALSRQETKLFKNQFAKKTITRTAQGEATVDSYLTGLLTSKWTPRKAVELRELRNQLQGQTDGLLALKDGVVRQLRNRATNPAGMTDWRVAQRMMSNEDGLAPMVRMLIPDPRERAFLTRTFDEAARVREAAAAAEKAVKPFAHSVASETSLAKARSRQWTTAQAKAGAADVRAAQAEASAMQGTARQRLQAATARRKQVVAPSARELSAFDVVASGALGGWRGMLAARGTMGLSWLRRPEHRQAMREAMRTTATSARGQELVRALTPPGINAPGAQLMPAFASGPQPATAEQEAP